MQASRGKRTQREDTGIIDLLLHTLRTLIKYSTESHAIYAEVLVQACASLVLDVSIFVTSYEPCFIDLEGLVVLVSSTPSDSNTPPASSMGSPDT